MLMKIIYSENCPCSVKATRTRVREGHQLLGSFFKDDFLQIPSRIGRSEPLVQMLENPVFSNTVGARITNWGRISQMNLRNPN